MSTHDVYVSGQGRGWRWRCLTCGASSRRTFTRRMDADDSANTHIDAARAGGDDDV